MILRTFAIFIYIFFATKQVCHLCRCTDTAAPFDPVSTFFLPCIHLLHAPLSPLFCSVSTSFILRYRPLPACVIAFFLPALRHKQFLFLSYKARLCAQNIIVRRPSAALPTAVTPCVRRPSSLLPTAAAHSALHAQPVTTGTQTPQQYTANRRLLCAAPSAIFFTIIHHHTLRETVQKDLSAHFCIKKQIFHTVVSFYLRTFAPAIAPVAELVDALDLGSSFSRSAGSIPVRRTHTGIMYELQRHRKVPQLVHLFL